MLSELVRRVLSPRVLATWFLVASIMSVTGPFGTYRGLMFEARLAYWATIAGLAISLGTLVFYISGRWWARYPFFWRLMLATVLFTLIFTPLQRALMLKVRGPVTDLPHQVLIITMLPLAVGLVKYLWLGPEVSWPQKSAASPRLFRRLAPDQRGDLLHLSVNDHYVVVLTSQARTQLLMRFSDAIAELDGLDGMQVHRSHWVARAAVRGGTRRNGKLFLVLSDGSEVPVSRGYQKSVTQSGLAGGA